MPLFLPLAFSSCQGTSLSVVALSWLSETAAPSSESQRRVLYPAGKFDFKNPSLSNPAPHCLAQGWCSQECSSWLLQYKVPLPFPALPGSCRPGGMLPGGNSSHLVPCASLQPEEESGHCWAWRGCASPIGGGHVPAMSASLLATEESGQRVLEPARWLQSQGTDSRLRWGQSS